ncbi:hypothetical protein HDV04_001383 [Boothiomyces sp. JEL0838]|nr:hypothetical protein HDV04_001383 [Boothiomyces sp. JEL0838]
MTGEDPIKTFEETEKIPSSRGGFITDKTKKSYLSFYKLVEKELNKPMSILLKNPKQIFDWIDSKYTIEKTKRDKVNVIKSLQTFLKIDTNESTEKLNEIQPKVVEMRKKELKFELSDLRKKYAEIKDSIDNVQHKLLLSLLINYDFSLRSDLINVTTTKNDEGKPYIEGKFIIFPEESLSKVKNKNAFKIELSDEDYKLIYFGNKYMLQTASTDRNHAYSKLVKLVSKKYLDKEMNNNDFRSIHSLDIYDKFGKDFFKKLIEFEDMLITQNHSKNTFLNHYVDKVIESRESKKASSTTFAAEANFDTIVQITGELTANGGIVSTDIKGTSLEISGTSTLDILNCTGAVDCATTLNVTGDTTLGVTTVYSLGSGAINCSSLTASGNATVDGTFDVVGISTVSELNAGNTTTLALECTTLTATGLSSLQAVDAGDINVGNITGLATEVAALTALDLTITGPLGITCVLGGLTIDAGGITVTGGDLAVTNLVQQI